MSLNSHSPPDTPSSSTDTHDEAAPGVLPNNFSSAQPPPEFVMVDYPIEPNTVTQGGIVLDQPTTEFEWEDHCSASSSVDIREQRDVASEGHCAEPSSRLNVVHYNDDNAVKGDYTHKYIDCLKYTDGFWHDNDVDGNVDDVDDNVDDVDVHVDDEAEAEGDIHTSGNNDTIIHLKYRQSSVHFASPYILDRFLQIDRENEPLRHEADIAMTEQRVSQGDRMYLHRLVGIIQGDSENERFGRA